VRDTFICMEKERRFVRRCPGFTPVLKVYIKLIICENRGEYLYLKDQVKMMQVAIYIFFCAQSLCHEDVCGTSPTMLTSAVM